MKWEYIKRDKLEDNIDFNTYDCGYIGGWLIADDKEKEKIIDALNSIPEKYLISSEEAGIFLKTE